MKTPQYSHRFAGDLLALSAMILFAGYSLFLRLNPEVPTLLFLFAFQAVGAGVFALIFLRDGLPKILSRQTIVLLVLLAFVAVAHDFVYFFSFRLTSVANAAVGHQTVSIFLLFFAPYFLKEKTTRSEWIAVGLGIVGTVVLFYDAHPHQKIDWRHFEGIALAVLSGMLYALLIILYRHLQNGALLTLRTINFFRYVLSVLMLLPFLSLFRDFHWTPHATMVLLSFGLLYAVIASCMLQLAMKWSRALHISVIGKSEPVFATLYAFLFLHEVPTWNAILGGAMIIGTSLWLVLLMHEGEDVYE